MHQILELKVEGSIFPGTQPMGSTFADAKEETSKKLDPREQLGLLIHNLSCKTLQP